MRSGPCLRLVCWLPSFLGQGDEDLGFHGLRLQASLSGINKIHIVRKRLNWQVEMVISIGHESNICRGRIIIWVICQLISLHYASPQTERERHSEVLLALPGCGGRRGPSRHTAPLLPRALCCPQLWLLLTRHLLLSFLFWNRRPRRWPTGLWEENASSRQPAASSSVLVST